MTENGLINLIKECSELSGIAAKNLAFNDSYYDPEETESLLQKMQDEIADVMAACMFVCNEFNFDTDKIDARTLTRLGVFNELKLIKPVSKKRM